MVPGPFPIVPGLFYNPPMTAAAQPLHPPLTGADVCRSIGRLMMARGLASLHEVPVPGGRRVDLMAVSAKGEIVVVEIKVSRADLLGDRKWTEYLPWCDRFYWALADGLDAGPLDGEDYRPDRVGLIRADRYEAAVVREARCVPLPAARRKAQTLRFATRAASRLQLREDEGLAGLVATAGF